MALSLLSGTTAAADFSIGGTSIKCHLNQMGVTFVRELLQRVTFCSSAFKEKIFGLKDILGSVSGYVGKGDAFSKIGQHFLTDSTVAIVYTFDTLCTISFTAGITQDSASMVAAGNTSRGLSFESMDDDVAIAWVTS